MSRIQKISLLLLVFLGVWLGGTSLRAQSQPEEGVFFSVFQTDTSIRDGNLGNKGVRPRVGLVLSGGGAKGIAHVGALKVIEELGIPIDFVGGTSMGSIVGGLYAYGYSAHQLDSIFTAADWRLLLNDQPEWTDVFYEDKKNYMLSLPFDFKSEKSIVPIGFLRGQHINNLFYTLTSQSYRYKNFKDFNIPFFCVGANIVNGQPVYMDSGNLALSMRASMAVPGVFAPVKLDTMILVDGGVLNNFPVDIMRERGADIVIGVDVGFSYAGAERATSFLGVLEEVVFMGAKTRVLNNRKLCDVLICPNMKGFNTTSFGQTDSLLLRGEQAARSPEIYAQLKEVAERLKGCAPEPEKEKRPYLPPVQVFVTDIRYEGLKKYNETFIHQFLQVEVDKWNKLDDITEGINRVYGTNVFSSVTYEFRQDPDRRDGTILVVRLEESPVNSFKVGVRYDNDRSAALLAGVKFRNLGFKNSALTVDVELSRMVAARIDYSVRPNWRRHKRGYSIWMPSANVSFEFYRVSSYLYRDPDDFRVQTSEVRSNRYKVRLYGQSNWKLNVLGGGIGYEYAFNKEFSSDSPLRNDVFNNSYIFPYLYFKHNSYNAKFYPTKGSKMNLEVNLPVKVGRDGNRQDAAPLFLSAYWTSDFAIGIGKHFALYPGFTLGAILFHNGKNIPIQQQFFQGSCADISGWYQSVLPGVQLGQSSGYELVNVRLTAQIMLIKNLYLSLRGGIGKAEYELWDMVRRWDRLLYGGNIGISYNTPVGPVGLSFQTSNVHSFNVFLNIGYWF